MSPFEAALIAAWMVGWPAGTLMVAARAVWGMRPRMSSGVTDKSPLLRMVRIFLSLRACHQDGFGGRLLPGSRTPTYEADASSTCYHNPV